MRRLHLFLDLVAHWWHRATSSRYLLMLEARVRQLESENAGLRDTVFGLRGLPPLPKGAPASYTAPAAVPQAAIDAGPGLRPKVDPVQRPGRKLMDIARDREDERKRQQAAVAEMQQIRSAFQQAVEEEKRQQNGEGVAVNEAGQMVPVVDR